MENLRFKDAVIFWLMNSVPYLLVSWVSMEFVDGDSGDFWVVFAVLIGVRLFFGVIETLGRSLTWWLYGRKVAVRIFLKTLQDHNFPKREHAHESFSNYLGRIQDGEYPSPVKYANRFLMFQLAAASGSSVMELARWNSAANAALDQYSSNAESSGSA